MTNLLTRFYSWNAWKNLASESWIIQIEFVSQELLNLNSKNFDYWTLFFVEILNSTSFFLQKSRFEWTNELRISFGLLTPERIVENRLVQLTDFVDMDFCCVCYKFEAHKISVFVVAILRTASEVLIQNACRLHGDNVGAASFHWRLFMVSGWTGAIGSTGILWHYIDSILSSHWLNAKRLVCRMNKKHIETVRKRTVWGFRFNGFQWTVQRELALPKSSSAKFSFFGSIKSDSGPSQGFESKLWTHHLGRYL